MTKDSLPVKDNNGNLIGENYPLNLYYAYGIHKGFGLDFDPVTEYLWGTETGHLINDEVNLVMPGFNIGYGITQDMNNFFPLYRM